MNRSIVDTIMTCEGDRCARHLTPTIAHWPATFTGEELKADSSLEIAALNPDGYGNPLERRGARQFRRGRGFMLELARRRYGVVIKPRRWLVDADARQRSRREVLAASS